MLRNSSDLRLFWKYSSRLIWVFRCYLNLVGLNCDACRLSCLRKLLPQIHLQCSSVSRKYERQTNIKIFSKKGHTRSQSFTSMVLMVKHANFDVCKKCDIRFTLIAVQCKKIWEKNKISKSCTHYINIGFWRKRWHEQPDHVFLTACITAFVTSETWQDI